MERDYKEKADLNNPPYVAPRKELVLKRTDILRSIEISPETLRRAIEMNDSAHAIPRGQLLVGRRRSYKPHPKRDDD